MAANPKVIDRGWKKFLNRIRKTPPEFVILVGIQGEQASADNGGITNANLGAIHEFGAPEAGIPQRSFLRSTIDRNNKKYLKLMEKQAARLSIGKGIKDGLELIGEIAVADVRKTFTQSIGLAPLKDATIRSKGSSKPLIDTATLLGSITAKVM